MKLAFRQVTFASKLRNGAAVFLIAVLTPIVASAQGAGTTPGIGGVPATPEIGACQPTKVKFSASPNSATKTTTSTVPVNVFEGGFNFTQGGTVASCVIVEFSAMAGAFGNEIMPVRALLDGTTTAQPGEMILTAAERVVARVGSVNFVFPLIAPGSHTIRMQWRSGSGGPVTMGRHITIVHFVP